MTRLQKKCLIAVAGTHLMLVVTLLCSGFFRPTPKPDDSQVLDVIPANIIDAAFRSGVRGAQPPPPTPIVTPPQQTPTPPPPTPQKQVEPVKPVEPVQQPEKVQPDQTEPKPPKHEVNVDLTPVVRKSTKPDNSQAEADAKAEKAARKAQQERARAIERAANAIRHNTSTSTTIDMPGDSSAAYADYASVVKTVYTEAWNLPDTSASDDTNVKVSVTISSDGEVTEAHIVERSGDASVDGSVQKTLDRVRQLEPFPAGSTDKERTYIINFNLKAKRMLG